MTTLQTYIETTIGWLEERNNEGAFASRIHVLKDALRVARIEQKASEALRLALHQVEAERDEMRVRAAAAEAALRRIADDAAMVVRKTDSSMSRALIGSRR